MSQFYAFGEPGMSSAWLHMSHMQQLHGISDTKQQALRSFETVALTVCDRVIRCSCSRTHAGCLQRLHLLVVIVTSRDAVLRGGVVLSAECRLCAKYVRSRVITVKPAPWANQSATTGFAFVRASTVWASRWPNYRIVYDASDEWVWRGIWQATLGAVLILVSLLHLCCSGGSQVPLCPASTMHP